LLFEDSTTDPFTGNFSSELQSTVDELIGDANYDIGHLFDFGEPNGDAGCIGCVCESEAKAQGYSTHPFTDIFGGEYRNDYFDLDYVGHEIGHQFVLIIRFLTMLRVRGSTQNQEVDQPLWDMLESQLLMMYNYMEILIFTITVFKISKNLLLA